MKKIKKGGEKERERERERERETFRKRQLPAKKMNAVILTNSGTQLESRPTTSKLSHIQN